MSTPFLDKFKKELNKKVVDYRKHSMSELMQIVGLEGIISIETLRRILNGISVKEDTEKKVLEAMRRAPISFFENYPASGVKTSALIKKLIGENSNLFSVTRINNTDLEILFELGQFKLRLRCIEDIEDLKTEKEDQGALKLNQVNDLYFQKHVQEAKELIKNDVCNSFSLISHFRPTELLSKSLYGSQGQISAKIKIVTVKEFVGQFFNVEKYLSKLNNEFSKINLNFFENSDFLNIPIEKVEMREVEVGNELVANGIGEENLDSAVTEFIHNSSGVLVLLGHHGSGKTVQCLKSSVRLILSNKNSERIFPLPIVLNASSFSALNTSSIISRIHEEIESKYDTNIPKKLIQEFINDGQIIVFIDGLDENRMLNEMSMIRTFIEKLPEIRSANSNAKYIITARHELFDNKKHERNTFEGLVFDQYLLLPCDQDEAKKLLRNKVNSLIDLERERIFEPLIDLIRTPLFLRLVSEVLTMAWKQIYREKNLIAVANARMTFDAFKEYTRAWAEREQIRAISTEITPTLSERLQFCELLASISWDVTNHDNGLNLENLKLATKKQYRNTRGANIREGSSEFELLLNDAKLSSCLNRIDDKLYFTSDSIRLFFLSRRLVRELTVRGFKFKILKKRKVRINEFRLFSLFILGGFSNSSEFQTAKEVINFLIETINRRDFISHCDSFKELATIYFNLVGFIFWITKICGIKNLASIRSRIYLPFVFEQDFGFSERDENLSKSFEHLFDNTKGNFEFSSFEEMDFSLKKNQLILNNRNLDKKTKIDITKSRIETLQSFCWENKILIKNSNLDAEFKSEVDLKWCIVPGGEYKVQNWEADSFSIYNESLKSNTLRRGLKSKKVTNTTKLIIESFLISQHPVTNSQFLSFILRNYVWSPINQREKIGNRWYLFGFNWIIEDYGDNIDDWNFNEIIEKDTVWAKSPVVSVTREAASAFAKFYNCFLPTEAQFEIACRLYQEDLSDLSQYPWGETIGPSNEWFIHLSKDVIPAYVPIFDCTVVNPGSPYNLVKFEEWVCKIDPSLKNVPFHLIGGVSEWMACQWDPFWPIPIHYHGKLPIAPHNDGIGLIHRSPQRIVSMSDQLDKEFAQRGGSYSTPKEYCEISSRSVQPISNVNEDVGFRCVKPIF